MLRVNGKDAPERSGAATHYDSVGNVALERLFPRINVEDLQQATLSPGQAGQVANQRPTWQGWLCWAIGPSCMSATKHVHDGRKATGRRRGSVPLDAAIAAFRKELGPTD